MSMPAKRKVEYYKLHKQVYEEHKGSEVMERDKEYTLQYKMPIYSKKDII
jgi:hypothetical protein